MDSYILERNEKFLTKLTNRAGNLLAEASLLPESREKRLLLKRVRLLITGMDKTSEDSIRIIDNL